MCKLISDILVSIFLVSKVSILRELQATMFGDKALMLTCVTLILDTESTLELETKVHTKKVRNHG